MDRIEAVDAPTFKTILETEKNNPKIAVVDVCSVAENAACRIAGVKNIPLSEIPARLAELSDKEQIYLHCFSGARSYYAAEVLKSLGVKAKLFNLEGGLNAWLQAGYKIESD